MSRLSTETALNGYDYDRQSWYMNGVYIRCGHPDSMQCDCWGRLHEGEKVQHVGA